MCTLAVNLRTRLLKYGRARAVPGLETCNYCIILFYRIACACTPRPRHTLLHNFHSQPPHVQRAHVPADTSPPPQTHTNTPPPTHTHTPTHKHPPPTHRHPPPSLPPSLFLSLSVPQSLSPRFYSRPSFPLFLCRSSSTPHARQQTRGHTIHLRSVEEHACTCRCTIRHAV